MECPTPDMSTGFFFKRLADQSWWWFYYLSLCRYHNEGHITECVAVPHLWSHGSQRSDCSYSIFMGTLFSSNSFVDFNLVEEASGAGVQCHTDLDTCCSPSQGQSHGDLPTGGILPTYAFIASIHIFQAHQSRMVELHCQTHSSTLNGIYLCDIETNAASNGNWETVYVGLYISGGQFMVINEASILCVGLSVPCWKEINFKYALRSHNLVWGPRAGDSAVVSCIHRW